MFLTLLLTTLAVASVVSIAVAWAFDRSIRSILDRLVGEVMAPAWTRYIRFAIVVIGISGGVRIYQLERYVTPMGPVRGEGILELDRDRWVLELYGTFIGTLQRLAWSLLVFFLFALIAYVLVRGFELRQKRRDEAAGAGKAGSG